MSSTPPSSQKLCVICGQDCAGRPRVKDAHGHYYCRDCHERQKERRAAEARQVPSAPPPPVPAARKPRPAPPPPPPAPSSDDDGVFGLLDAIGAAETNADGIDQERAPCPSCQMPLPTDVVICMRCGFNKQLGRRMGEAQIEGVPQAKPMVPGAAKSAPRAAFVRSGGSGGLDGKEWILGVGPAAILIVLFALGKQSEGMMVVFSLAAGLFALTFLILLLVFAFMDSVGQGFLCMCVPFYALYWIFGRNERAWLKWMFAANVVANVLAMMARPEQSGFAP